MLHQPVMVQEFLDLLPKKENLFFVDCTIGAGGHTAAFLEKNPSGQVLGIDQDCEILEHTKKKFDSLQKQAITFRHANFSELDSILSSFKKKKPDALLMDLGVSSFQLSESQRGFSFLQDGPLDMRMNPKSQTNTAADILKTYSQKELADLIFQYGDERLSRRIAQKIVEERQKGEIRTTHQLARLVCQAYRKRSHHHPATRTFQALRIEVNQELNVLRQGLDAALEHLAPEGRLMVLSFHSGEDRIVKNTFRFYEKELKKFKILTKKPLKPSAQEMKENVRSRSACFRVGAKL